MQTNWAKGRAIEEVEWVQSVADRGGWPHAIVSFVDFQSEDAPQVMAAQAKSPLMRGVRQQLHWHTNPQYRFAPAPDQMNTPSFRRNFALLQDHGWLFELQVFASQMADGAGLAKAFPGTTLVLKHAGMPEDRSVGRRRLARGHAAAGRQPNMHTKFSGLGTFIHRNDPAHIADIVGETLETIRCQTMRLGIEFPDREDLDGLCLDRGRDQSGIEIVAQGPSTSGPA